MKQDFTEQAIVLKVGVFREADCWVRLVTKQRGLLTAFAFGGCKSRRRFSGCLDPFSLVHFRITSNTTGEYLYLNEGTLLERFAGIRSDMARLGMAVNCLKFVEAAQAGSDNSGSTYGLLLESLRVLDGGHEVSPLFPLLFRARFTFEQGYRPDLFHCGHCGRQAEGLDLLRFVLEQGKVFCSSCLPEGCKGLLLTGETAEILREVFTSSPQDWERLEPGKRLPRECLKALDQFVQFHMGLEWQGQRFQRI